MASGSFQFDSGSLSTKLAFMRSGFLALENQRILNYSEVECVVILGANQSVSFQQSLSLRADMLAKIPIFYLSLNY